MYWIRKLNPHFNGPRIAAFGPVVDIDKKFWVAENFINNFLL